MFRNILQSLFSKGLVALINFFLLILSSHYLGVKSRGEIGILILNISIIQIINDIYTGYTLVYFIPRFDIRKLFANGIVFTLLSCTLSNSVFFILKEHIPGYEGWSFVISLLVILHTFNCVIILGKEKIAAYNFLTLVQPVLLLLGLITATVFCKVYTFSAFVVPLFVSFVLAFVISFTVVLKLLAKNESVKEFKLRPIFVNGIPCQLAVLMSLFCNRYSYYLLNTSADVGLYSSASSLIESVLIISNGIAPVLLSKVANEGDNMKSRTMTLSLAKASFFASAICIGILACIPDGFYVFLLNKGFTGIGNVMMMYAPGILMLSFAGIISHYFSATGKLRTILLCNSLGFVSAMILSHALIPAYGIKGAAISADISYTVLTLSLCVAYFLQNNLKFTEIFFRRKDYYNLRSLLFNKSS